MARGNEVALRAYVERILGWQDRSTVDRALRSIQLGVERQAALVIRGEGDLVPVAVALHRRAVRSDAPFVVSDPRRGNTPASVRSPANFEHCLTAFEAARGGTLCVRLRRLPPDFSQVVSALREPSTDVQLVVCCHAGDDSDPLLAVPAPLDVPPLRTRTVELERIVNEYGEDATTALGTRTSLSARDRIWIVENAATSLDEIEKATLRITALRVSANMSAAAARLGMAPVSLSLCANVTETAPLVEITVEGEQEFSHDAEYVQEERCLLAARGDSLRGPGGGAVGGSGESHLPGRPEAPSLHS